MVRFLARRLLFCAALVVITSSVALLLTRVVPGDLGTTFGLRGASPEAVAERARYGVDRPAGEQWREWIARAARLDFGESFLYRRPVGPLVLQAAENTAVLAVAALIVATIAGIGLGIVTGSRRGVIGRASCRERV